MRSRNPQKDLVVGVILVDQRGFGRDGGRTQGAVDWETTDITKIIETDGRDVVAGVGGGTGASALEDRDVASHERVIDLGDIGSD